MAHKGAYPTSGGWLKPLRLERQKRQKKIFIICPVRNVKPETVEAIGAYVANLESQGHKVFWPYRDNPFQETDTIGFTICKRNREEMLWADEVHIWYDKTSTGSVFDLGMFFAMVRAWGFKKFVIINREAVSPTPQKSFENVILALEKKYAEESEYYGD